MFNLAVICTNVVASLLLPIEWALVASHITILTILVKATYFKDN